MADPAQLELLEHYKLTAARSSGMVRRKHELDWERETEIGRGYYTTIYRETERITGAVRAVKEIRKARNFDALTRLAKPAYTENFGRFLGWWETEAAISFALEFFEHGDLRKFLGGPWPEHDSRDIAIQLLSGLSVMHNDGFTHRDLKPENIFVVHTEPFFRIKIGDFGVSKRIDDKTMLRTQVGTKYYLSPEVLDLLEGDSIEYTNAVDIWAVGVIIFETLTASKPFADSRALKRYCQGKKPFPTTSLESEKVSMEVIEVLECFLKSNPRDRPCADTAMQSPWFESATSPPPPPPPQADDRDRTISKLEEGPLPLKSVHATHPSDQAGSGKRTVPINRQRLHPYLTVRLPPSLPTDDEERTTFKVKERPLPLKPVHVAWSPILNNHGQLEIPIRRQRPRPRPIVRLPPSRQTDDEEHTIPKVTESMQELEKVHLRPDSTNDQNGRGATKKYMGGKTPALCPSRKLVTLRKDLKMQDQEQTLWTVEVSASPDPAWKAPFAILKHEQTSLVRKHYKDLDPDCITTVERLRADWIEAELNPDAEWVISSIEEEKSTKKLEPAENREEVVHFTFSRQRKLKLQSPVQNNHSEPGKNESVVKEPGFDELEVDYCIAPCSWGIARSVPFDVTKHRYNQRYWHPVARTWCVSKVEWIIFKANLFDKLYFPSRFELTSTIEFISMILLTSSSREPSGLKDPVVETFAFGVPQYYSVDMSCRTLRWSVSEYDTTIIRGDPQLALQLSKSTLTVIMEIENEDPPRYITLSNNPTWGSTVDVIETPKVLWLY